jgi:hypothetical protein
MGMTEQKAIFLGLREIAEDTEENINVRINAWCEWGRMSRNSSDASLALRNIQDLVNNNF